MGMRINSGGGKEFYYTKEDLERIRKSDTKPSRAFKRALKKHYKEKHSPSGIDDDNSTILNSDDNVTEVSAWWLLVAIGVITAILFFIIRFIIRLLF